MTSEIRVTQARQTPRSGAAVAETMAGSGSRVMDEAALVARLERAGATMMAMPARGYSTQLRRMRFDVIRTDAELSDASPGQVRAAAPNAAQIREMDETFGWLALIPEAKFVLRRLLGARALVHPLTGRHLYSWRRLGEIVGSDHKSVKRWHGQGIAMLLRSING